AEGVIPSSASTASACSLTAGSVLARICAVLPIGPPVERIPTGIRPVWGMWAPESRGGSAGLLRAAGLDRHGHDATVRCTNHTAYDRPRTGSAPWRDG